MAPRSFIIRIYSHLAFSLISFALTLRTAPSHGPNPTSKWAVFIAGGFPRITTELRRAMVHPAHPLLSVTSPRVLWGDDGEVFSVAQFTVTVTIAS